MILLERKNIRKNKLFLHTILNIQSTFLIGENNLHILAAGLAQNKVNMLPYP